jgi:hypothetical protein
VLERNGIKKNIQSVIHNLRAKEFASGKVQESAGMSWRINWHKLCWDFSVENKIQWHNGDQVARLIYRNELGYWNFNSQDLNNRFLLFFQKAMLTNDYLELEMGNPNQYDGTMKYRGEFSDEVVKEKHVSEDELSISFSKDVKLRVRPISEQDL